jgi:hypothetical protein
VELLFRRHVGVLVVAGTIAAWACTPAVAPPATPPKQAPSAEWPDKGPPEDGLAAELEGLAAALAQDGFLPLPTSCAAVALPVATAEQAVCIALDRVGADLRRSDHRYVYKGRKVGETWELSIWPVAAVFGGGCEVTISAESGAIIDVFWDR